MLIIYSSFDIPECHVITKDRLEVVVNAILFCKITDPYKAVYAIDDPYSSVNQKALTTIRSILSKKTLDEAIEAKEAIRAEFLNDLDHIQTGWGLKITQFEIQAITPSKEFTTFEWHNHMVLTVTQILPSFTL